MPPKASPALSSIGPGDAMPFDQKPFTSDENA
jgi:hypothetical protein